MPERENQLRQSEAQLRAILDSVLDGIITIDQLGTVESFNRAAERVFGYAAAEVIGRNVKMLMPEPYHTEHDGYLERYMTTGDPRVIGIGREVMGRRKDGSTFPLDLAVTEMELAERRVFVGIVRDITDRKQAQNEIRKLHAAVEQSPVSVVITDTNGDIEYVNPKFVALTGYSFAEVRGRNPGLLKSGNTSPDEYRDLWRTIAAGGEWRGTFKNLKKSGEAYWEQASISAIRDAKGEITHYIAVKEDITERKLAEQRLQETMALQRAILNGTNYAIISTDVNGVIRTFNAAAERMLGYAAHEVMGKATPAIIHDPAEVAKRAQVLSAELGIQIEPGFEVFVARARRGQVDENEWTYLRKDGSRFPVMLSVTALLNEQGVVTGFLGVGYDLTERKKIDRMKSEFVSTVSHELRTPLTSIRGSLGLVAGGVAGELPARAKSLIDIAYNNSERLVRLINDILDVEKIESGKMSFDLKPQPLAPLIEAAIEANHAYGEQFQVRYQLAETVPDAKVLVDADRLTQVMTNLLSNAAKFSPAGETVSVRIARHCGSIRVSVSDRGAGIPEEFRDRIFRRFSQADASDSRQKGGTGLGLAISRAIVEKMGGQIGFDSAPGAGTTFRFELPEWRDSAAVDVPGEKETGRTGVRILVCEDEHDIAALLKLMLEQGGFAADIAHDAPEARLLLARQHYAAMTLDLMLPGQDGISFLRELRTDEATRGMPVIVVSAKADQARLEVSSASLDVVDWLSKPIDRERLVVSLKAATSRDSGTTPVILHVEDDPDIRQLVATILKEDAEVVPAESLQQARSLLQQRPIDLVILDIGLPDGSGLELLATIDAMRPSPRVVVFSAQDLENGMVHEVAAALTKSRSSNEELLEKIRALTKDI